MDDDEINDLLNGNDQNIVQPGWNVNGGNIRETMFIPTSSNVGFDDSLD